jgi:hypothetical protein
MTAPARFFVRLYTPDPAEEGPDREDDTDVPSADAAKRRARKLRREGKLACAFERRNIRYPEEAPPGLDLPAYLYDCEDVSLEPEHGS